MRDLEGALGGWWWERRVTVSRGRLWWRLVWLGWFGEGGKRGEDVPIDSPDAGVILDYFSLGRGGHGGEEIS